MENLATLATWIWQYGIVFLLVLTLVVFIHELGHFLVARWCGVRVLAFSKIIASVRSVSGWCFS